VNGISIKRLSDGFNHIGCAIEEALGRIGIGQQLGYALAIPLHFARVHPRQRAMGPPTIVPQAVVESALA
jgi:hypothetical protein